MGLHDRVAALVGKPLFWVLLCGLTFGVPVAASMLRKPPTVPKVLSALPPFDLTDQEGHAFGTRDLAGKVWVANFIFTSCPGSCPVLSGKMASVMKRARKLGPEFHLVSFTVDPENDTPEKLAEYGARFGANPHKWSFLTGPMDVVQRAVVDGFKISMGRQKSDAGDFWEVFHGEHFVLVDRRLRIRGYYEASQAGLDHLVDDIGTLVNFDDAP